MNIVSVIPALYDNFIYIWRYEEAKAAVIDPCEGQIVLDFLKEHNLTLTHILVTHNHFDHTGGIAALEKAFRCQVTYGREGNLKIGNFDVQVIKTPGHTAESVCYFVPAGNNEQPLLFTGDTLFAGGCGRIFTGQAQTMWQSLQKLAALPDDTLCYPGHDYTVENYEFALSIEPDNEIFKKRLLEVQALAQQNKPTVPSTIAVERETNIFLLAKSADEFAKLRKLKDRF